MSSPCSSVSLLFFISKSILFFKALSAPGIKAILASASVKSESAENAFTISLLSEFLSSLFIFKLTKPLFTAEFA